MVSGSTPYCLQFSRLSMEPHDKGARFSSSSSKLLYGGGMATDLGSPSPFGSCRPGSPEVFCSGEVLQFLDGGSSVFYV
ncbi:unnamed protein product [Arabidopsis arenosa]|uniref:Uncharacterized protein n=1 Tax=Arabidopsis arenosa TaxID=38785 RepID=A0A8S2ACA0_ARAAE|nr:unnamed protein product [Arabidopsis arenosa]